MTVVLVTHEDDIAAYAKRVVRMRDGMVISDVAHEAWTVAHPGHEPTAPPPQPVASATEGSTA
jgi:putative ABC transport system ATP-binding protein